MTDRDLRFQRYCRSCGHSLYGLASRACPECGRAFDPDDPVTTAATPSRWEEIPERMTPPVRTLIRLSAALAGLSFVLCVLGFDRPRLLGLFSCSCLALPLAAFVFAFAAQPRARLSWRLRLLGLTCPLLFISIEWTHWPLLAACVVCRPWLNLLADDAQGHAPQPTPWGYENGAGGPKWLRFRRGRVLPEGNVGFQLTGGDGGGIYLVRGSTNWSIGPLSPRRVWYNTNWELSLGGEWHLVDED